MVVTLFPNITSLIDLFSLNQDEIVLQLRFSFVILLQPEKAYSPMVVTLLGIVILVRPLQPLNALSPMLVTLLGIVMLVSPVQLANAPFSMLVTLFPNITSLIDFIS